MFSRRKHVLEVRDSGDLAGFTVLTEKAGGSLKTGPTVLLEEYRRVGIGLATRQAIHELARSLGFRKVYCTAPLDREDVVGYLLASGYRIEAHLMKRYHEGHDELVLGTVLDDLTAPAPDFIREVQAVSTVERLTTVDPEVSRLLQTECEQVIEGLDRGWGLRQVSTAAAWAKGRARGSRKRILFVGRGLTTVNALLCTPKRGGSVKVTLATNTAHMESNCRLVETALEFLSREATMRMVYTNVPIPDRDTYAAFIELGFRPEGILERPYGPRQDFAVLARTLRD